MRVCPLFQVLASGWLAKRGRKEVRLCLAEERMRASLHTNIERESHFGLHPASVDSLSVCFLFVGARDSRRSLACHSLSLVDGTLLLKLSRVLTLRSLNLFEFVVGGLEVIYRECRRCSRVVCVLHVVVHRG